MKNAPATGPSPRFIRAIKLAEGKDVERDLVAARAELAKASQKGELNAVRVYTAFLAAGIGGERDWRGAVQLLRKWATRDRISAQQARLIGAMAIDEAGDPPSEFVIERLHETKRLEVARGFMTPAECQFLVAIVQQRFRPAMIARNGVRIQDPVRNNETASFPFVSEWPFVHAINRRIAAASGTDVRQGEPLNILRYQPGQEYKIHCDAAPGQDNQRILTALVYLNDDYTGGETAFPTLGVSFKGAVGDMMLFGNATPDGDRDLDMQHAGTPVLAGTKLIASRWIRQRPPLDESQRRLDDPYSGNL